MSRKRKWSKTFSPPSSGRKRNKTNSLSFSGRRSYSGGRVSRTLPTPEGTPPSNPVFRRVAGRVAGASLGYILGNVPGAVYGYNAGGALADQVDQTKMKDTNKVRGGGAGSLGYQRSAMKVKGKAAKVKKVKKVKVSKYLKAAIKQVNKGQVANGYYTRISTGMVGSIIGNAVNFATTTPSGFGAGQVCAFGPNFAYPAGCRSFFNQLHTFKIGAVTTPVNGADLNFFTPAKILHAASVMFNGKGENIDPTIVGNNLSTNFNDVTGLTANLDPGSLKIDVIKSWVKFSIKNVSDRVVELDIWELGPKLKFEGNNALDSLINAQTATVDHMIANNVNYALQYNLLSGASNPNAIFDGNFDPVSFFSKYGYNWKGKHRMMTLQPDETCVHNISGPSGLLDYAKLNENGLDQTYLLYKGFSVSTLISVRGDQVIRDGASAVSQGQRDAYCDGAVAGKMGMPVAIELSENYKLKVPEIAGFLLPGLVNQTNNALPQALDFRKNRRVITNLGPINGSSEIAGNSMQVSNSTNPLLEQTGTQQN